MAQQTGIIKLRGSIGDIVFVRTKGGYIARKKSSFSKGRNHKNLPPRMKQNMDEFSQAINTTQTFRRLVNGYIADCKDSRVSNRLSSTFSRIIKLDDVHPRGQRRVLPGNVGLLEGFNFNDKAHFDSVLKTSVHTIIDRPAGICKVNIGSFVPADSLRVSRGPGFFRIVAVGIELDFVDGTCKRDYIETPLMPIDNAQTEPVSLQTVLTPGSTKVLILLAGIKFFHVMDGKQYPSENRLNNAMQVVRVSGQ